ncbi:MAG: hypothetical protein GY853_14410 [PVC group bacterium]|nr:hypothetical protein [PVC group bacterium]
MNETPGKIRLDRVVRKLKAGNIQNIEIGKQIGSAANGFSSPSITINHGVKIAIFLLDGLDQTMEASEINRVSIYGYFPLVFTWEDNANYIFRTVHYLLCRHKVATEYEFPIN